MMRLNLKPLGVLIVSATVLGCHSESSTTSNADDTSNKGAPADSANPAKQDKLAKALASAIVPNGDQGAATSGGSESSPPADGVLDPSKAATLATRHSAPTVKLGSPGSEPRVKLAHRPFTIPVRVNLQVGADLGNGQGVPPVDFKVELRSSPSDANGIQAMNARVISADVSLPNVPDEFKTLVRKLQGAKVSFKVAGNGGAFDYALDPGKSKSQGLGDLLDMVAQGLADACQPVPADAVGVGGFWMTTYRQGALGLDWVRYDMVKVAQIRATEVKMDVTTRRYVVGRDVPIDQGSKLTVREASASGNAQVVSSLTSSLVTSYERTQSARLVMDAADNSGQRMMQAGGQTKFSLVH